MATICNGRISTTYKYASVIGVPQLSLDPLEREYSDGDIHSIRSVSSSASTRAAHEHRKISRAEGCLITKQPGFHLKKVYWVNPVRKNVRLKYEVETFLKDLHIVGINFTLDAPSNITPMDRNLHYALEKLGFLAVTCSKATLQSLILLVEKENLAWQERMDRGTAYVRDFNFNHPPFIDSMYELVLLHPHHYLQKGSSLTVYTEDRDKLSGKMYLVSPDGALREGPEDNKPRLPAFSSNRAREPENMLNPFLVVINAAIAFRRFKRRPHVLCAEYTELIDLTLNLAKKIYFKPLVNKIERQLNQIRHIYSQTTYRDVNMRTVYEFGTGKAWKMGTVVKRPGLGASHQEIVDYRRYLMSGCDYRDDDEDDDDEDTV